MPRPRKRLHQIVYGLVRIIAPLGLVVPQRPQRRQFRRTGKARISGDDVQRSVVVNEIIIHQAPEGPEGKNLFIRSSEVEIRTARVVKQQAVRFPFPQTEEKGNTFVKGIRFLMEIIMVRSPHGEILAPQVQGARLVPKPEKMLRFLEIFPYPYPGVSSPVLALPAESALIRQQGLIRGNIVKIHLFAPPCECGCGAGTSQRHEPRPHHTRGFPLPARNIRGLRHNSARLPAPLPGKYVTRTIPASARHTLRVILETVFVYSHLTRLPRRGGVFRLSGMLETEHIEAGRKRGSKAFSPD